MRVYRTSFGVNAIINSNKVLNFHIITNTNLISVDNGVDAETIPVNTHLLFKTLFIEVYNSAKR